LDLRSNTAAKFGAVAGAAEAGAGAAIETDATHRTSKRPIQPFHLDRQDATVVLQEAVPGEDGTYLFRIDVGAGIESGGRDSLFLSLVSGGKVYHYSIVTRSNQLYLGTRPFTSLEHIVEHHQETRDDFAIQCPLTSPCDERFVQQLQTPGLVHRPLVHASRQMLECDALLDELEEMLQTTPTPAAVISAAGAA
jgi:hypothetical protein